MSNRWMGRGSLAVLAVFLLGGVGAFLTRPAPSPWSDAPLEAIAPTQPLDPAAGEELESRLAAMAKAPEYARCAAFRPETEVSDDCIPWLMERANELDAWFTDRSALSFPPPAQDETAAELSGLVRMARSVGKIAAAQEPEVRVTLATAGLRWGTPIMRGKGDLVSFAVGATVTIESLGAASDVARSLSEHPEARARLTEELRAHPVGADARRVLTDEYIHMEGLYPPEASGIARLTYSRAHTMGLARRQARANIAQLEVHVTERAHVEDANPASGLQRLLDNPIGRTLQATATADLIGIVGREDIARGLHAGLLASLTGEVGDDGTGRPFRVEDGTLIGSMDGMKTGSREAVMRWPVLGGDGEDVPLAGLR